MNSVTVTLYNVIVTRINLIIIKDNGNFTLKRVSTVFCAIITLGIRSATSDNAAGTQ